MDASSPTRGNQPPVARGWGPLGVVGGIFLAQVAAYGLAAAYTRELRTNIFELGNGDFLYFYHAATAWLAGQSPYRDPQFVTPPASMLPAIALHRLPLGTAQRVFTVVTAALMGAGLWRFGGALGLTRRNRWGLLGVAAVFVPLWMLLNAGNMDGLMLALLLYASTARGKLTRAALLGASIAVKLYSGLLLVVLTVRDRLREAELVAVFAAVMTVPFWGVLSEMAVRLTGRGEKLLAVYNISPALLAELTLGWMGPWAWKVVFWTFWLGTLAIMLARTHKGSDAEDLAKFAPWMMAAPVLVFCYCAILALPTLALLLRSSQEGKTSPAEWRAIAGIVLLGLHPEFVPIYLHVPEIMYGPLSVVTWVMGSAGTTLLLIGMVHRTWGEKAEVRSTK
jgi:hypothetical protein